MDSQGGDEASKYLDVLLNTPYGHLKSIRIVDGEFKSFVREEDLPGKAPHINKLVFATINMDCAILPMLFMDFPALDYLELSRCQGSFRVDKVEMNIFMPNTAINTLRIDTGYITHGDKMLLSVCSLEEGTTKYYVNLPDEEKEVDSITYLTTKEEFDKGIKEYISPQERNLVTITAKSIKEVLLTAKFEDDDRCIEMDYP